MPKLHQIRLRDLLNPACGKPKFRIRADAGFYNGDTEAVGKLLNKIASLPDETEAADSLGLLLLAPDSISGGESQAEGWEVLDGHQLIVTLFLLLRYLDLPGFIVEYEGRSEISRCLEEIPKIFREKSCVGQMERCESFTEFTDVWNEIENWFLHQDVDWKRETFIQTFLNAPIKYNETDSSSRELFLAFSRGRFALASALRLKNIFSGRLPADCEQTDEERQIVSDWEAMEEALSDDAFWSFLQPPESFDDAGARISFIFHLLHPEDGFFPGIDACMHYQELRKQNKFRPNAEWGRVRECFQTVREWFCDPLIRHRIGILRAAGHPDGAIEKLWARKSESGKESVKSILAEEVEKIR